jgi:hypothetical protein
VAKKKAKAKRKFKNIDELTAGYEEFIAGKEINPNHRKDFDALVAKSVVKLKPPKGR